MADKQQPKQPGQSPAQQPSSGNKQLNEGIADLTRKPGGYTVTNTRPAPPNPDGGGGKDGKR